jgi:hypothetical protein
MIDKLDVRPRNSSTGTSPPRHPARPLVAIALAAMPPNDTEGQAGLYLGADFAAPVIDEVETPTHRVASDPLSAIC